MEQKGQTGISHSIDLLRKTQNCNHGYINEIQKKMSSSSNLNSILAIFCLPMEDKLYHTFSQCRYFPHGTHGKGDAS